MDKLKHRRRSGYTVLPNEIVFDDSLSLGALGLLGKMMALPDGWNFSVAGLAKYCHCGKDKIRTCLRNIESSGYLLREQERDADGKFANTYVLYDTPDVHRVGLSDTGNPRRETRREYNTIEPIPPIVPQGGQGNKSAPKYLPERFDAFWSAYPKKQAKQNAIKAWDKLKPTEELLREVSKGLKRWMQSEQWSDSRYIPMPATWLNQRRWEDEVYMSPQQAAASVAEAYGWR